MEENIVYVSKTIPAFYNMHNTYTYTHASGGSGGGEAFTSPPYFFLLNVNGSNYRVLPPKNKFRESSPPPRKNLKVTLRLPCMHELINDSILCRYIPMESFLLKEFMLDIHKPCYQWLLSGTLTIYLIVDTFCLGYLTIRLN